MGGLMSPITRTATAIFTHMPQRYGKRQWGQAKEQGVERATLEYPLLSDTNPAQML